MKNLQKLIDPNIDRKELDQYMSQIIKDKLDADLKEKYKQKLAKEYRVEKTQNASSKLKIWGLISFLLLLSAYFIFKTLNKAKALDSSDYNMIALNYDKDHPFEANVLTRNGSADLNEMRADAYSEFEKENYKEASQGLSALLKRSKEDHFLLAYANFKMGNFEEAYEGFSVVLALDEDSSYLAEAKLYKILSLFADGRIDAAHKEMKELDAGSWEAQKLKEIFKE